ncbi:MAG: hypothetical protein ACFFD1_04950 [Candidatus Thorarchaeota archaeon]
MNLVKLIEQLEEFDDSMTIYAEKPWSPNSKALVEYEPETGSLPENAKAHKLSYFLEVFIARDFLNDWIASQNATPSLEAQCKRLISYALNDA